MNDPQKPDPQKPSDPATSPWAPWWVYLIVLLGANYLRAAVMRGQEPWMQVAVALPQAAVLFVIVTIFWRRSR